MYMTDFVYADEALSDYGSMVSYINTSVSEVGSMGSVLSRETITNHATHKLESLKANYDSPISFTLDISKNDCGNDEIYYNDVEMRHIMRWLNQKQNKKLMPIYDDASFSNVFYWGTFTTIEAILMHGKCIGFTLTFESNSPFGYEECMYSGEGKTFYIDNISDEIGMCHIKDAQITVNEAGNLLIRNSLDDQHILVNNCVAGETLSFDGEHLIIQSNKGHAKLYNDFNYNFPRLISEYKNTMNVFTSNLSCKITMTYDAIRKVGIIA